MIKVPNNIAGNGFIADLRKILKGTGRVQLRGRNPNRKQFYPEANRVRVYNGKAHTRKSAFQQDLPLKFASHYAVYIWPKDPKDGSRVWGMVEAIQKIYANHKQKVIL